MFKKNVLRIVLAALFDVALIFVAAMCIRAVIIEQVDNRIAAVSTCHCNLEGTSNE